MHRIIQSEHSNAVFCRIHGQAADNLKMSPPGCSSQTARKSLSAEGAIGGACKAPTKAQAIMNTGVPCTVR